MINGHGVHDLFYKAMKRSILIVSLVFIATCDMMAQIKENKISSMRSEIILNGLWDFQPASDSPEVKPVDDWGQIRVPGVWDVEGEGWGKAPGVTSKGKTTLWSANLKNQTKGWYKKTVVIPMSWKGRAVEIELEKVSTDAIIYINGKRTGVVNWYTGKVDLSKAVNYGKTNEILIYVIATPDQGELPQLMGTAESQVSFTKATLASRGITGSVVLQSRPSSIHISDVFVKTSVRKNLLEAEVELQGVKEASTLEFTNLVYKDGQFKKTFKQTVKVGKNPVHIINLAAQWPNAEFWDFQKPNLYELHTIVSSGGKKLDEYVQSFGFREFWIEGKDFYLNGLKTNLRPFLGVPGSGMHALIEKGIEGLIKSGHNFSELWPENFDVRGDNHDWTEVMHVADRKGYLLSGVALSANPYIMDKTWSYQWDKPGLKEKWNQRMLVELKRQRNHPSVVMWATGANFFGHSADQDPVHIGQINWSKDNPSWQRNAVAGMEAIKMIKAADSTRPVFTHHGAYVGDVHTLNFYLNLIPLQEREEWMSQYAAQGKLPFIGIEFGTPFYCTFLRGRNGYGNAIQTEPLATEYSAMYAGTKAYTTETPQYRRLIKDNFLGGQKYKSLNNPPEMVTLPAFQDIQYLFTKNTWRSWRTWGVAGGMIPWDKGYGWLSTPGGNEKVATPPFQPGQRGNYFSNAPLSILNYLQPEGWEVPPAGKAMIENGADVLAYIAGSEKAFTDKNHHFKTSEEVKKQFIFFNDTRGIQTFTWDAKAILGGKELKTESGTFNIAVGDKKAVPFTFNLPAAQSVFRKDGQILLTSRVNGKTLADTFNFKVFSKEPLKPKTLTVFDPEGKTSDMLSSLGYTLEKWDGSHSAPSLIIGRNALLSKSLSGLNLEDYVAKGGKVLLMNQYPDSMEAKKGFRVSPYISRYVFPVNSNHSLFKNLDENDFRNWTGESTLTEAYPSYTITKGKIRAYETPYYGYHWGNRGGVATGAVEKPHRSGWRPLMECEFDMAWSPLMELPYGKGHLVYNNLDLEDHYQEDVIAAMMCERLISYVDTLKPVSRSTNTILLGNDTDQKFLSSLGVNFKRAGKIVKGTELLIVGNIKNEQQPDVLRFARGGGKVIILPRNTTNSFLGVSYKKADDFAGAYHIPNWPEAAGISISDSRYRANFNTIVLSSGCEIGIDGLLGRKAEGKGTMLFTQFDPNRFDADSLTYFRFTRWRQTRALSQVLSNAGCSFVMDRIIFGEKDPNLYSVNLAGNWKAMVTNGMPAAKDSKDKYKDQGITPAALNLVKADADESKMYEVAGGEFFEKTRPEWKDLDGEVVYRKTVQVLDNMLGEDLSLHLGVIDDYDQVYVNGELVGQTGMDKASPWSYERSYVIPAKLIKRGANVVAIRVFDGFGGGGLVPTPKKREIVPFIKKNVPSFYHPDYLDSFDLGDDPFRYFRW